MTAPRSKRILFRIGIIISIPILLLGGCLLIEQIPMSAARPPESIRTIQDFHAWKRGAIMGKGEYESAGLRYTVMLAPAGRYLASGPSAYLFDARGRFVDWTADLGDFPTIKNHFDLSSGHVKHITREKPPNPATAEITGERKLISEPDVREILNAVETIPEIVHSAPSIRVISADEVEVTTAIIRGPEEHGRGAIAIIRREKDGWRWQEDGMRLWRE